MSTLAQPAPDCELTLSANGQALTQAFASFREAAGWLEKSYTQLKDEVTGLRLELEGTNRDLTRSLEENQRTRMHLDQILQGLPCGVLVCAADGSISVANPEARKLLGVSPHCVPAPEVERLFAKASCAGSELEYEVDGNRRWLAVRCTRMEGAEGGFAIFIVEDVTEWRRLRQEHEELKRKRALAQMSALLAHEVRNPLATMELFAGLLAGSPLPEECCPWVRHLQAGLRSLSATVNNVLHFHSAGKLGLVPTDIAEFLDNLREFLLPVAEQSGVEIEMAHRLQGVTVPADLNALKQVLLNLAMNALHFMPSGGRLTIGGGIGFRPGGNTARICVSDTGPGIPPEHLGRIFDPGFSTRPGSAGLGLAVCKTIMDAHRGEISVRRGASGGTCFTLELPGAQV
ncbi:MAG TPA: ATP-binding protein [Terriglobales bacterium]|nr:ATP-binding protein [Terriglobales bacterium]